MRFFSLREQFRINHWLPTYRSEYIRPDIFAGVTVAVMLVPQGMAYAMLAGVPPVHGLYAGFAALLVYSLMGSSRHLSVGPVAIDSMLVAASVGAVAVPGDGNYLGFVIALAFMVGAVQLIMGFARLGYVVNFLSMPVLQGFVTAAAIIIGFSQVKYLLGLELGRSQFLLPTIAEILQKLPEAHLPTCILGAAILLLLVVLKVRFPKVPGSLIGVVVTTALVYIFRLDEYGVEVVGDVPHGLPLPSLPHINMETFVRFLPSAVTIALVSFIEAIAVAQRFARKLDYSVDSDQELKSLGVANMASAALGGHSIAGSFSRSAVNAQSGAKTQLASLVNAAAIALILVALTPLFHYLPNATLAAVTIMAVASLIEWREAYRLYRIKKNDFLVYIAAFFSTLLLGVQNGILVSFIFSIVMIVQRIAHPHVALMGEVPGSSVLRNFQRDKRTRQIEGLLIIRIDASLYFANIAYFKDKLYRAIAEREDRIRAVIIDASSINEIDISAEMALEQLLNELTLRGTRLCFTNVKGPVRDVLRLSGFYKMVGHENFFLSKKEAVEQLRSDLRQDG